MPAYAGMTRSFYGYFKFILAASTTKKQGEIIKA
jgi:hypothetical protein